MADTVLTAAERKAKIQFVRAVERLMLDFDTEEVGRIADDVGECGMDGDRGGAREDAAVVECLRVIVDAMGAEDTRLLAQRVAELERGRFAPLLEALGVSGPKGAGASASVGARFVQICVHDLGGQEADLYALDEDGRVWTLMPRREDDDGSVIYPQWKRLTEARLDGVGGRHERKS